MTVNVDVDSGISEPRCARQWHGGLARRLNSDTCGGGAERRGE
jgi:hypothetical protein